MLDNIWQMLVHTPWWVYVLFVYLVFKGVLASRGRIISLKKLLILPVVLLALSIYGLLTVITPTVATVGCWIVALIIGGVIGWAQIYRQVLWFDKRNHLVKTPGTWSVLILILVIFASKYYFDYTMAVNPNAIHQFGFEFGLLAISGIAAGILLGRMLCYWQKMQKAEHTELKPT